MQPSRRAAIFRELARHGLGFLAVLVVVEVVLHVADFPYLRAGDWGTMKYRYDAKLGWSPIPGSRSVASLPRRTTVEHNRLGIRDVEFERNGKPTILFMGDSLTWGYNVEASERFSDLLRERIPSHKVLNAGVSGYGTDQAYLFLERLWKDIEPSVVVLMFCVENDHVDNSRNLRYFNYKPYLEATADGGWRFAGQPAPVPRKERFQGNWFTRNLAVVRLAISAYVELAYPRITVPDATEPLISMLRAEVEQNGARFLVGLERQDPKLETFLQAQGIPYTRFDGAELYESSHHWSPKGNALVAERLAELLSAEGIAVTHRDDDPTAGIGRPR